jgi:hypothetical protein
MLTNIISTEKPFLISDLSGCVHAALCCLQLYPANATCDDIDSPQNNATTEALNCTAEAAMGAYAFQVAEPAAFKRNGEAPVDIAGQNFFQALDLCCEKVRPVLASLLRTTTCLQAARSSTGYLQLCILLPQSACYVTAPFSLTLGTSKPCYFAS